MEDEGPDDLGVDESEYSEARIDNISVSNLGFIVFLRIVGDSRLLPIFIGANEAQSIALVFNNQVPPRPMTHDLMKSILGQLECDLTQVRITALSDNTFYARIYMRKEGIDEIDVDARPSDAIALALRFRVPILVRKDVFEAASIQIKDPDGAGDIEEGGTGTTLAVHAHQAVSKAEKIKQELEKAISAERYEEAARLRDELKKLQSGN